MTERCSFCAKKLNDYGHCENQTCPDNLRRKIIEKSKTNETENPDKAK